jgi:hypothetical protein
MSLRLPLAASAALASLALAASASASVSFVPFGAALPPGETTIYSFATLPASATGNAVLDVGSQSGVSAAPDFSGGPDAVSYLSVQANESETLALNPSHEISVYVGSLDSYNTITFGGPGGGIYTGGDLATMTGAHDDGNQTAAASNGRFIFDFAAPVTSVTFSSTSNAFEIASVAGAVPEPAAWALMLIGFAGVGAMSRRRPSPLTA